MQILTGCSNPKSLFMGGQGACHTVLLGATVLVPKGISFHATASVQYTGVTSDCRTGGQTTLQ